MFTKHDMSRNACQLFGGQAKCGYDWWWHSFTGIHAETGEERPFFVEYFLCNPASGGEEPIFGQLPQNKESGKKPSYFMVKAGAWGKNGRQLHRFFGWKDTKLDWGAPFKVGAEDCFATENEIRGSVRISEAEAQTHPEWMCDAGSIAWNLEVEKLIPFHVGYGAGTLFRKLQLFEMFWHAEGMKSAYRGEVIWEGERYLVTPETCYRYQDKN